MKKHCVECGIIFETYNPEQERCELCNDDRENEEGGEEHG